MFLGCHDSMVDLRCDEKNCAFDEQIHMKIIPCSIFSWPNQVKSQSSWTQSPKTLWGYTSSDTVSGCPTIVVRITF